MTSSETSETDLLRRRVEQFSPIPESEWALFSTCLSTVRLKCGDCLLKQGEPSRHIGFILAGALRIFYKMPSGAEFTRNFSIEGQFACAYSALLTSSPSPVTIEALEEAHVVTIPYDVLLEFYERHSCWQVIGRKLAEHYYLVRERHSFQLLAFDAEERYQLFAAENPGLVDRIMQKHLATYLGINPVSLSRLLRSKKNRS